MRMFEDLLTSYRGAGVIGTCLAFFVLVSVVGLSLFVFEPGLNGLGESGPGLVARQEREIGRLEHDLAEAQAKYEDYREARKFHDEVRLNVARQDAADARLTGIAEKIDATQAALAGLRSRQEDYAAAYRDQVREKAAGEVLPTMTLPDGRRLESPVVVQVNPAGIQLRYQDGIVRVPAKDLPAKVRERFQFDAAEMERFLEQEKAMAGKLERDLERGLVEIKDNSRKEQIARLEARIPIIKSRVAARARQYASLRGNPRRNYNTLTMLIRQVDADEKAIFKYEAELAELKAAERAGK
ncbi:hypothetical protein [Luteolibacter sp. Populi]|uniref:hypothetical protein n=1 Tax=Luteolibacter sp. Populi TaxID=3230487 RepID=UPI0034678B1D